MWMSVSHYYGTFSAVELKNAQPGTAAFAVACGEVDYMYFV